MAAYFHGNSEIQGGGDGLQTLILMNPAYVGYSDSQPQHQTPTPGSNFMFFNSNPAGSNSPQGLPHAPPSQTQHFVGIPLQGGGASASPHEPQAHDISALHGFLPRVHYGLYNLPVDAAAAREVTRAQQGLSLSLSSQQPPGCGSFRPERLEVPSQPALVTAVSPPHRRADDARACGGSPSSASGMSNGVLLSSKYLKAAQDLLEEVVNVGKAAKTATESSKGANGQPKNGADSSATAAAGAATSSGDAQSGGDPSSAKRGADLTTSERQEIQMKKAKLVNMLDEVEQRYRQYHQQMQIVISWFEQAAGIGSAKTYTALALQTISKQFRCLKDAILGQIREASKSLGEEDGLEGGKMEGSRLKYVDNQIRQQRALQQLGMIQHNAWRPQRGLPERSVSVLRAWLFEHFLHPYPKDSDKIMLAKQTGLTRSQVSNWFINARVRLWKPMVEEMYVEEMKEKEKNGTEEDNKAEQNADIAAPQAKSPPSTQNQKQDNHINQNTPPGMSISTASVSPTGSAMRNIAGFNLIRSSDITHGSPKKLRNADILQHSPMNMDSKLQDESDNDQIPMKFNNDRQGRDGFTLMGAPTNFIGGFGSYPMSELGRFSADQFQAPYSTNGVSLTLGLPHCDMSGAHQSFLPNQSMQQLRRGVELGETNDFNAMNAPANTVYENINIQNRKRFAAQLLPDFVT